MTEYAGGIFQTQRKGGGVLRDAADPMQSWPDDVVVPQKLIQQYGLMTGMSINGVVQRGKTGAQLSTVETICGLTPAKFQARVRFEHLVAVNPNERIRLGDNGNATMRVVDLIAPVGKGTRGMIVAPPKAGKTLILEQMANAVTAANPEMRVLILLIDERPEEVTHFRRNVAADVWASSNDQGVDAHIALAELAMAHIRYELECGRNLVVLLDSITRLSRAYNLFVTGANRTLSGGIDAKALEAPRRLFGLARAIENGGSVTVIATALVGTGSRMDDYIFEEFKGTGNSEIVLDRALAEARIYPAINLLASGTRKEELLYSADETARMATLRRWLAGGSPAAAMRGLLKLLEQSATNAELLARIKPAR